MAIIETIVFIFVCFLVFHRILFFMKWLMKVLNSSNHVGFTVPKGVVPVIKPKTFIMFMILVQTSIISASDVIPDIFDSSPDKVRVCLMIIALI